MKEGKPMHILITNDDGVDAKGIKTLAKAAADAGHSVVVAAPATQQSATGHRLTINDSLMVKPADFDPRFPAFAIGGTPVDSVRVGRQLTEKPIDFCLSGINDGNNAGTDLFYSGTAAAAREAAMLYIPAMAVSIAFEADEDMRRNLAQEALRWMEFIIKHPMPRLTFCNLNAPALPPGEVKPVKLSPISQGFYLDRYVERVNPRGVRYFWLEDSMETEDPDEGSDMALLRRGHMTLTFVGGFYDNNQYYQNKAFDDFPS